LCVCGHGGASPFSTPWPAAALAAFAWRNPAVALAPTRHRKNYLNVLPGDNMNSLFQGIAMASRALSVPIGFVLMACIAPTQATPIPQGPNLRIMPIGDSITEGKYAGNGGYRKYLQNYLGAGGYSYTFVGKEDSFYPGTTTFVPADHTGFSEGMTQPNHEGYGSFRIDEIMNGGTREGHTAPPIQTTLANGNPDVILMMLGTNDVLQHYDPVGGTGYNRETGFAANAAQRLNVLLSAVFAAKPSVMVVLAQITPLTNVTRDADAQAYNAYVPQIVAQYQAAGKNIVLVNQHAAFNPATETNDGTHPTASGFQKMAALWYQALTGKPVPVAPLHSGAALAYSGGTYNTSATHYSLGYTFTTGPQSLVVSELGYLNDGKNNTHEVRIYKVNTGPDAAGHGTGTLVPGAAASVTTTGADTTTFTYAPITPVTLAPNTSYEIVATNNGNGFLTKAGNAVYNGIVYGTSTYKANTDTPDFNASTYSANDVGNLGPNFKIAVPPAAALSYSGGTYDTSTTHYSLGYTFTTGAQSVVVTSLGYLNDGRNNTHQVGIYKVTTSPDTSARGTGTLVPGAAASVTTSGSNMTTFTYAPITPVTLAPNTTYEIVANNNGNGFLKKAQNAVILPGIVYGTSTFSANTDNPDFNPSTYAGNDVGNLGPNFLIAR
jgi:lysophospholipase L1-like esterase